MDNSSVVEIQRLEARIDSLYALIEKMSLLMERAIGLRIEQMEQDDTQETFLHLMEGLEDRVILPSDKGSWVIRGRDPHDPTYTLYLTYNYKAQEYAWDGNITRACRFPNFDEAKEFSIRIDEGAPFKPEPFHAFGVFK